MRIVHKIVRSGRLAAAAILLAALALGPGGCVINKPTPGPTAARRAFDPHYGDWNTLLARHVTPQGVDYAAMKKDEGLLEVALLEMALVTPAQFESWSREARLAFLINAHNAHAVMRIVQHYPVRSLGRTSSLLMPARGVRNIRLLGREWSLGALAEEIAGYPYHEARAVFLLNWGARGNAPLPNVAVSEENLDGMLKSRTRAFMTDPANYRYDAQKHIMYVSRLIKWYGDEIERDFGSQWDFVRQHLPKEVTGEMGQRGTPPRLRWLKFDKSLNEAKKADA